MNRLTRFEFVVEHVEFLVVLGVEQFSQAPDVVQRRGLDAGMGGRGGVVAKGGGGWGIMVWGVGVW